MKKLNFALASAIFILGISISSCQKAEPAADNSQTVPNTPQEIEISANHQHTHYIKTDNTLWGTGENERGQLGDGTDSLRYAPVKITNNVKATIVIYKNKSPNLSE